MRRVRIFIDFWNFSLGMNSYDSNYRVDWDKLSSTLVHEATLPTGDGSYEGSCIYVSINSKSDADLRLKDFLLNTVNRKPGYQIKIFERKPAKPAWCNDCQSEILVCPKCNTNLKRLVEKGVDASIVTDMLQHAWDDTYDVGVLLSADADFIPAVSFLNRRGKKIAHASFTNLGQNLANECWKQINLRLVASQMAR